MADYARFGRRLKELIAGEDQVDVGKRLGYTQSRVSQMCRGEKPSREFVERLVVAYDLPREEWLQLAGFREQEEEPAAYSDEWADRIAERAVDKYLARQGSERLVSGLAALTQEFGRPIPVDLTDGTAGLTVERAETILADLRKQLEEGLI